MCFASFVDLEYCGMWWLVFATVLNQSLLQTQMDRRKPLMNTVVRSVSVAFWFISL